MSIARKIVILMSEQAGTDRQRSEMCYVIDRILTLPINFVLQVIVL